MKNLISFALCFIPFISFCDEAQDREIEERVSNFAQSVPSRIMEGLSNVASEIYSSIQDTREAQPAN